ncbi:AAA family ATPase [Nocardioides sp. GXZ039]|uniref:AAA family ATPase n=1 Tax=Nocardioides sp. GXZ039 TaxID=3136018 RepID=UPI0030F4A03A
MHGDPAAFAPRRVIDHGLMRPGASWTSPATTLMVDLEGFTPLIGRLAEHGSRGTEQLGGLLRGFFSAITGEVVARGGDPIAFGGDALTFVFDAPTNEALQSARDAAETVARVAGDLSGTSTLAGPVMLRARIGIARGPVTSAVAHAHDRAVAVHLGPGLDLAETAQAAADVGGVHVDPSAAAPDAVGPATGGQTSDGGTLAALVPPRLLGRPASEWESHRQVSSAFVRFPPVDDAEPHTFLDDVATLLWLVTEWEGEVVQVSGGDKGTVAMVVFGAPLAHADDASRATQAALRLRERAPSISVGVATGRVFTALVGSAIRSFPAHVGLAVTTAARLMQAAGPGEVLVDDVTWDLASAALDGGRLAEPLLLKGHAEPVVVHRVDGWGPAAASEPVRTPIVGQAIALDAIDALLAEGGALTLAGGPGTGKTRLLQEAAARATARGSRVVATDVGLHPRGRSHLVWRHLLADLLGLAPDADPRLWHDALAARLPGRPLDVLLDSPLWAEPPEVEHPSTGRPPEVEQASASESPEVEQASASERRRNPGPTHDRDLQTELVRDLLARLLRAPDDQPPLLVAIDNADDLDGLAATVLDGLGAPLLGSRTSLLLTRDVPGAEPAVPIGGLSPDEAERLAAQAWREAGGGTAPSWLAEAVAARAGTNPLYIRTAAQALWAGWQVGSPPPPIDHDGDPHQALAGLLREQVDRLDAADREVLEHLAVLGQPSDLATIATLSGHPGPAPALERLATDGLAERVGEQWRLPHRTLRDVVHSAMSHAARGRAHRRAVDHLAEVGADPVEIADHVAHLDDLDLIRRWFPPAAASARRSWDLPRAAEYLERVRPLLTGEARDRVEIERLEVLRVAGRSSEVLAEAREPTDSADPEIRARRALVLTEAAFSCGEFEQAAEAARTLLTLSEDDEARYQRGAELLVIATSELGDTTTAIEAARTFVTRADAAGDLRASTAARAALGAALLIAGLADEAVDPLQRALAYARTTGDAVAEVHMLSDLAGCAYESGNHSDCLRLLSQARTVADHIGYRRHLAMSLSNEAQLRAGMGDRHAGACASVAIEKSLDLGDPTTAANALHTWLSASELAEPGANVEAWRRLASIDASLGRVVLEARDRAGLAVAAAHAGDAGTAAASATAAEEVAAAVGRADLRRRAGLARSVAEASNEDALASLRILAEDAAEEGDRRELAEIAMERWRRSGSGEDAEAAFVLLESAHEVEPSVTVRAWFAELGASAPPMAPSLPPPVGLDPRARGGWLDLDRAFTRVEEFLESRQRSE